MVGVTVRRERRWTQRVQLSPGNWFAPSGSNRSGSGGNEAVGAIGVEGRWLSLANLVLNNVNTMTYNVIECDAERI